MSLLNLLHQSVVLKFTESAKPQFDSETGYVFRLVGVDAMGFLQLQDLRVGPNEEHETISEPYWINKDLVRAIHDYVSVTGKDELKFTGAPAAKPVVARDVTPKPKRAGKAKTALA
jgi:hypothetical protein